MKLTRTNLKLLSKVSTPRYAVEKVTPGIFHFGVGGFHRSHLARYTDSILESDPTWGIIGSGILESDLRMSEVMSHQDCLYSLIEMDKSKTSCRIIGSIIEYIYAPRARQRMLDALSDPSVRIVSLTITESGYLIDSNTGKFNPDHPLVKQDLNSGPITSFGYICRALERRMKEGIAPFTVMSCDNLLGNGHSAKMAVLGLADAYSPQLSRWIEGNVTFPNSMVDRITPVTTDEHRKMVHDEFGLEDEWPVVCESFTQWIVEDSFCNGRPDFSTVGAQFVKDVEPYEQMKLRLLNASHSALGYLGYLCGHRFVDEATNDPDFAKLLRRQMSKEVIPTLPAVTGIDLSFYQESVIERFGNSKIRDQLLRICSDGSGKIPKFILPSVRASIKNGEPIECLSMCVAAWIRFLDGVDESGSEIPIHDPMASSLAESKGLKLLQRVDIFGDLVNNNQLTKAVSSLYSQLKEDGARVTLRRLLA